MAAALRAVGDGEEPRAQLAARIQELWQAAGEPDLDAVAAAGGLRSRHGRAAGGVISSWKNGNHVPDRWERLQPVLADLEARARRRGVRRLPGADPAHGSALNWEVWKGWWATARGASRTPAVPAPGANGRDPLPPAVGALMQRQVVAAETLPYPLYEGSLPQLSQVHVRQLLRRLDAPADGPLAVEAAGAKAFDPQRPIHWSELWPVEAVLDNEPGHLLVVAGPGGGKSTLALRLAGELARGWLAEERPAPGFIPLHVTATQVVRGGGDLTALLAPVIAWQPGNSAGVQADQSSLPAPLLVMIDGLDEITDTAARRALNGHLAALTTAVDAPMRLLVTTRPLPAPEMDALRRAGFARYALEPFTPEDLQDFAQRWFAIAATEAGTARAYLDQVALSGLRELVRVPLLATLTAVVFEAAPQRPLPSSRYRLYEHYRAYLARTENTNGFAAWYGLIHQAGRVDHNRFPDAGEHTATLALREGLLHRLAVEEATGNGEALLTTASAWLEKHLGARLQVSVPGWRDRIAAALVGTGLLVRRPDAEVEFLHASIAEHLAAEYFATRLPQSFRPASPRWTRAILKAGNHGLDRAVLLHYTHHRPAAGAKLLDWLMKSHLPFRTLAEELLADGARAEDRHYDRFLSTLPDKDSKHYDDWWQRAERTWHPLVDTFLDEHAQGAGPHRLRALWALTDRHPQRAAAAGRAILADPAETDIHWSAAMALGRLGPAWAEESAPHLRRFIEKHARDSVYGRVAVALQTFAQLGPQYADEAARALRHVLYRRRDHRFLQAWALSVYPSLGREYREETMQALYDLIAGRRDRIITVTTAQKWLDRLALDPGSADTLFCHVVDYDGYIPGDRGQQAL